MNWSKIWLVLRREYTFNFRRPAFLFTAFGVPLFSLGAMFIMMQFVLDRETNLDKWQRIAYIDRANVVLAEPHPNGYVAYTDENLERPAEDAELSAYFDALEASASQHVLADELDAYFVVTDDYLLYGNVELYAERRIPEALREELGDFMSAQIATRAPVDLPVPVARLTDQEITLRDLDSGEELTEAQLIGRFMLPIVFIIIYFMATNTTAQFLMSGVVEEKENRLMEILATSLRPLELLWGKLLGLGALALTQVALWAGAGVLIAQINDSAREFLTGVDFAPQDIALLLVLFVVNFFLFSATMLAVGASVTAETESRQLAGVFSFIAVLPLVLMSAYMINPNGILPQILTFFPYTSATSLILRLSLTTVPTWQTGLSLVILLVSIVSVMWLAAKIFRLGMLMYGKALTPRTLWYALREGRQVMTTASTAYDNDAARPAKKKKKGWLLGR